MIEAMLFTEISTFLQGLHWADAILGTALGLIASGAVALTRVGGRALWDGRPLRRFLGDLVVKSKPLSIFVREMVSRDMKYYSRLPSGEIQEWQNFPVVGLTDVSAVSDVLNLLGQAGRASNITWRKVTTESDRWDEPLVCVGGSFKLDQVLQLCEPRFVTFRTPDTFQVENGRQFKADLEGNDFALVARTYHPQTQVPCLVLFGCGTAGTEAAGAFFRRNAPSLARLYGAKPFAVILQVGWHDGTASAATVWMSQTTGWFTRLTHPIVWWKYRKLLGGSGGK